MLCAQEMPHAGKSPQTEGTGSRMCVPCKCLIPEGAYLGEETPVGLIP